MDTLTSEERSARMARVRSRDTKPERKLARLVWGLGHRYRKNSRRVPGHPDIVFLGRKQAIFLHGCFWHRHACASGQRMPKTRVDFWSAKFARNVERDATVARELDAAGWRSLVIWECELRDTRGVTQRVREFLDA